MKFLKFKRHRCCEKCRNYWTCETKWYRGEKGKENICCDLCAYYPACFGSADNLLKTKSPGVYA